MCSHALLEPLSRLVQYARLLEKLSRINNLREKQKRFCETDQGAGQGFLRDVHNLANAIFCVCGCFI